MSKPTGITTEELYRKGDKLIAVHFRKNGEVYYHQQNVDDDIVSIAQFQRTDEIVFDRLMQAEGGEKLDEWPRNAQKEQARRNPETYFEPDELEIFRLIEAANVPSFDAGPDPFIDIPDNDRKMRQCEAADHNEWRDDKIKTLARDIEDTALTFPSWCNLETNITLFYAPEIFEDNDGRRNIRDVFAALAKRRTMRDTQEVTQLNRGEAAN